MKYSRPKILFGMIAALMLLHGTGSVEHDTSVDRPEFETGMERPYDTSDFSNISGSENEFFNHANSNPANKNYSSMNWMSREEEEEESTPPEKDNETEEGESEEKKSTEDSEERSYSYSSEKDTRVYTDSSWSTMSATLSQNSANPNETVYIQGSITGDQERKVSVLLGEEKITEIGPLNGSFKIPVKASEVEGRELSLEAGGKTSSLNLDVNYPETELKPETPGNCNKSFYEPLIFSKGLNLEVVGIQADRDPCQNSSNTDRISFFNLSTEKGLNSSHTDNESFNSQAQADMGFRKATGMFSQSATEENILSDVKDRIQSINQEIDEILGRL